jgi:hypothetical protein
MLCLTQSLTLTLLIALISIASAAPTKSQYLAQREEHALDANWALTRSWHLLEYYWEQLLLAPDQVYVLQMPTELNEVQGHALVTRLERLGWHAWLRRVRVTNATCGVDGARCRCRCRAVDGFALGSNFMSEPNQALSIQDPKDRERSYMRVYTGTNHVLWTQPSDQHWNATASVAQEHAFFDNERHYERYLRHAYGWREGEPKPQRPTAADCERLTPRELDPVQLLFLDTFP